MRDSRKIEKANQLFPIFIFTVDSKLMKTMCKVASVAIRTVTTLLLPIQAKSCLVILPSSSGRSSVDLD